VKSSAATTSTKCCSTSERARRRPCRGWHYRRRRQVHANARPKPRDRRRWRRRTVVVATITAASSRARGDSRVESSRLLKRPCPGQLKRKRIQRATARRRGSALVVPSAALTIRRQGFQEGSDSAAA
jgi:hypothetical protein